MRTWPVVAALALVACGGSETSSTEGSAGAGGTTTMPVLGGGGTAPDPGWYGLAPLLEPLQENAVVRLGDEVVVVGGFDDVGTVVDRVEAYDPADDAWRSLPALPAPRHHVNAAVVDGVLYVVGSLAGQGFSAQGEAWAYDPAADAWFDLTAMPAGSERGGAAVGVVGSRIIVAGGYRSGAVADVSAYDTATDSWEALPDMPATRDHIVGGVIDGVFYAVGGRDGTIASVDDAVYALVDDAWSEAASMITARGGAAAATTADGRIVVIGGEGDLSQATGVFDDVEIFAAGAWSASTPMTTPVHGTGAVAIDGVVFVPGGAPKQGFGAVDVNQALVLP